MSDWHSRLDAVAEAVDSAEWERARFAYESREEKVRVWVDGWMMKWVTAMSLHPRIKKSERTIYGWAQAYACWITLKLDPAIMALPFSAWEVWHKYIVADDDPTDQNAKLIAVITQWAAEPGGTIEGLAAFLAETFGGEGPSGGVVVPVLHDAEGLAYAYMPPGWDAKVKQCRITAVREQTNGQ